MPKGNLFQAFDDKNVFSIYYHKFETEKTETLNITYPEHKLYPRGSTYDSKRKRILMYVHANSNHLDAFIYKFSVTDKGGISFARRTKFQQIYTKFFYYGFVYDEQKDQVYVQYTCNINGNPTATYVVDPDTGISVLHMIYPPRIYNNDQGFFYHKTEKKIMFVGTRGDFTFDTQFYVVGGPNDIPHLPLKGYSPRSMATLDGKRLIHIDTKMAYYYELDFGNLNSTKVTKLEYQYPFLMFISGEMFYYTSSLQEKSKIHGFNLTSQRYISSTNTIFRASRTLNTYIHIV